MDTFKSEDHLKADNNDRYLLRQEKISAKQKTPLPRQYLLMGIGIIIILSLIISIASSLKSSTYTNTNLSSQRDDERDQNNSNILDLRATQPSINTIPSPTASNFQNKKDAIAVIKNDTDKLTLIEREKLTIKDHVSSQNNKFSSTTLTKDKNHDIITRHQIKQTNIAPNTATQQITNLSRNILDPQKLSTTMISTSDQMQSAPGSYYTLQLSAASQATTLVSYAHQQQLINYLVYQTSRNGKPWYILISGIYPSISQAKNAIAQLPSDVRNKKPWVRKISQIKKIEVNN